MATGNDNSTVPDDADVEPDPALVRPVRRVTALILLFPGLAVAFSIWMARA